MSDGGPLDRPAPPPFRPNRDLIGYMEAGQRGPVEAGWLRPDSSLGEHMCALGYHAWTRWVQDEHAWVTRCARCQLQEVVLT